MAPLPWLRGVVVRLVVIRQRLWTHELVQRWELVDSSRILRYRCIRRILMKCQPQTPPDSKPTAST